MTLTPIHRPSSLAASHPLSRIPSNRRVLVTGLIVASAAWAQLAAAEPTDDVAQLPKIGIEGEAVDGYKTERSASTKYTAPLIDTPKSVTIINEAVIEDTASTTLADALRTVPGITMAMGEGGTPFADRPFIRGFESTSGLMLDGLRDTGSQSRDTFNLEQIEVAKGPSGAYAGRGAPGGTINLVTKSARADNFLRGTLTLGDAETETQRMTFDGNYQLTEQAAVRLNLMTQEAEVAGRDGVEDDRWGVAPTITLGLGTPTRVELGYYHFETDGIMDYGHPYDRATGRPVRVDRDNFYGLWNRDHVETVVDAATLAIEHDLNDRLTISNITRWERSSNDYITSNPDDSQGNIPDGLVFRSPKSRNSDSRLLINQTELAAEFATGSVAHSVVAGLEISREETHAASYRVATDAPSGTIPRGECALFGAGAASGYNCTSLANPNPADPWSGSISLNAFTDTEVDTRSLYVFDSIELNARWLASLGLRYDDYDTHTSAGLRNEKDFVNWQAGLVYKPATNGSIYVSAGTASSPPGATAGEGGENISASNEDLDPQQSTSYELGTKWELFERRLSLTAAVFRTELDDVHVATEPGRSAPQAAIGEYRVDGVELGFSGRLTDRWQLFGGYLYMDSEIIEPGPIALTAVGKAFPNTPENSATLWTTYQVTDRFTVGGGAYYMGKVYGNTDNTLWVPSYTRVDAMASLRLNDHLTLRLNVQNLTDETYYSRAFTTHMAAVGPGRSVLLGVDLSL